MEEKAGRPGGGGEARRTVMVTGGAGFIGSHLVRRLLEAHPRWRVVVVDALTYAGNLANLDDVAPDPRYHFVRADVCSYADMARLMRHHGVDGVIHLAAESHVDRSISDPDVFARTNVMGTLALLRAARDVWAQAPGGFRGKRFHQVSTDEVFGTLPLEGGARFTEKTPYAPHSPYSASKAAADHFVRAFHDTYGLPAIITNCSNNYGPNQFPEKLMPLVINNIRLGRPIPVYGSGANVRDWLYVGDHARALDMAFCGGADGDTYAIGGDSERSNLEVVRSLCRVTDALLGRPAGQAEGLITFVGDRQGHDLRYAIDASHIRSTLGWRPEVGFQEGLRLTVQWYLDNQPWLDQVTSGDYLAYYDRLYGHR